MDEVVEAGDEVDGEGVEEVNVAPGVVDVG